jgi:streptogramin lyase
MSRTFEPVFRAPYAAPNGLQATKEGLWIVDQVTDRVALVETDGPITYGLPRVIAEIATESSNTSGMTFGGGALWLAANGPTDTWRTARPTDAVTGEIFKVEPATGATLARYPVPDGGGTHGIEFDNYEDDVIWLQTLSSHTITKVRISDWSIVQTLPLSHEIGHGMVRVEDGIWIVYRPERIILKHALDDGRVLDRIENPEPLPEAHGLTAYDGGFLYCSAETGDVIRVGP